MATTIDRRRNNGPQSSYLPTFDSPTPSNPPKVERQGEEDDSTGSVFLQVGLISGSNGSSFYERDSAKVLTCIYGPRPRSTASPAAAAAVGSSFSTHLDVSVTNQDGVQDRLMSGYLATALRSVVLGTRYPKSEIAVVVRVVQDSRTVREGLVACLVSASLALVDAGIQVYDLLAAATVSLPSAPDHHHHDDDDGEGKGDGESGMVIGYLPNRQEVTFISMAGGTQRHGDVDYLMKAAIKHAEAMHLAMTKVLMDA